MADSVQKATNTQHNPDVNGDDVVDMDAPVTVLERETVYRGAVFAVEDMRIRLATRDSSDVTIRRQVLRHAPCVVMLVHDTATDRYLMEREYRVGSDRYAYGIPAGLMDPGEEVMQAALRELREETGVVPDSSVMRVDRVADCYSSEGMADELAHIMVIHMDRWTSVPTHPDKDEHVWSAWVTWSDLTHAGVTASNSIIAIQHEAMRRLRAQYGES